MNPSENKTAACRRYKDTPRSEAEQRQLQNRLNRMIGQLGGIKKMVEENRYCGDILNQVAAVESALQNFRLCRSAKPHGNLCDRENPSGRRGDYRRNGGTHPET